MSLESYIKDTKGELKHVTWLNKKQVVNFTIIVVVLSVFVGFLLGFFDFIFAALLKIVL